MRYAEALRQALGTQIEVRHCDGSAAVPPPGMLDGDGRIVSPEDIALSLSDRLGEAEVAQLRHVLEATLD